MSKKDNKKKANIEKSIYKEPKKHKTSFYIIIGTIFVCIVVISAGLYSRFNEPNTKGDNQTPNKSKKETVIPTQELLEQNTETSLKVEQVETTEYKAEIPFIDAYAYGIYYKEQGSEEFTSLYKYNESSQHPPASITKLMTALVALEQYPIDKEVLIPSSCVNINGSSIGLRPFEVYTLQDLLYGLLVKSAADAGCAIASIDNAGLFIERMNEKAIELGLEQTIFQNAIGFDAGSNQVSTISDLEKLSEEALKSSTIRKIVGTEMVRISPINTSTVYELQSTNDLLSTIPGTVGLKTGYTEQAGECLAYLYDENGKEIMIIILGSSDRFGDTTTLLNWAKNELQDTSEESDKLQ